MKECSQTLNIRPSPSNLPQSRLVLCSLKASLSGFVENGCCNAFKRLEYIETVCHSSIGIQLVWNVLVKRDV